MSLLHRNLVASAFQEMLKKFEPIAQEAAEAVVSIVAPQAAPFVHAGIEMAEGALGLNAPAPGATTSDHIAAGVAAASAPPVAPAPVAAPAAPAPAAPASQSFGQVQAALAAVDSLAMQMSQIATQLAAIRANLSP